MLHRPLHSRDTALMVEALRELGATITEQPGDGEFGPDWLVTPGELTGGVSIAAGLAGTVMRFIPPVAALALGPVAIDGDENARRRPMRTTIQALRDLGVEVGDDGRGTMPFTIQGSGAVEGGELTIDASASSQFVSGLLLAAPRFRARADAAPRRRAAAEHAAHRDDDRHPRPPRRGRREPRARRLDRAARARSPARASPSNPISRTPRRSWRPR